MTITVTKEEAAARYLELLEQVEARRDEVVIADGGTVIARLSPDGAASRASGFGTDAGRIWMSPNFNDPMEEFEDAFYNGPIFPETTQGANR
jgi:antitoxin (DNA-binding transcriptional repressor) of toxin-antitoxin stability system